MNRDLNENVSHTDEGEDSKVPSDVTSPKSKSGRPRPSMQIYKPPGMRSGKSSSDKSSSSCGGSVSPPSGTDDRLSAMKSPGVHPPTTTSPPPQPTDVVDRRHSSATEKNASVVDAKQTIQSADANATQKRHASGDVRAADDTAAADETASKRSNSAADNTIVELVDEQQAKKQEPRRSHSASATPPTLASRVISGKQSSASSSPILAKKAQKLKESQVQEARMLLDKLAFDQPENSFLYKYADGAFSSVDLAASTAQLLVQSAIEKQKNSKQVAKLCFLLMASESGVVFHGGVVGACWEYFDCREKLRQNHLKFWLAFVSFISDLYATVGFTYEGELVDVLVRVFLYMLNQPVLDKLNIEELEALIGSLLLVGYDLERQCPEKVAELRDTIRDALVTAGEPWCRKMILLLMELSASGWKLPTDASEYYFQQTTASVN